MTYVLTADNLTGRLKRYLYLSNDAEGCKYIAKKSEVAKQGAMFWRFLKNCNAILITILTVFYLYQAVHPHFDQEIVLCAV